MSELPLELILSFMQDGSEQIMAKLAESSGFVTVVSKLGSETQQEVESRCPS